MSNSSILFNEAYVRALVIIENNANLFQGDVTLLRDVLGRYRFIHSSTIEVDTVQTLNQECRDSLGRYCFNAINNIILEEEFSIFDEIKSQRKWVGKYLNGDIYVLDRLISGHDWQRYESSTPNTNKRFVFYGIKGGVGRSTAIANWAYHLAQEGKKVLIFDLDLESPGVSSTLLPKDSAPSYGIVDWFIEDAVGQADLILDQMSGQSPLAASTTGAITIVPACGEKTGDYIAKLSRCYADVSEFKPSNWSSRLEKMIHIHEELHQPDVVILDSRSGIDDIAGVVFTQLNAEIFIFALDAPQTWHGYKLLFSSLSTHPGIKDLREKLKIVCGMLPETNRQKYQHSFIENSWTVFQNLYDLDNGVSDDAFNFDKNDTEAPHYPVFINWHRALQEFNPCIDPLEEGIAKLVYHDFHSYTNDFV